LRAAVFWGGTAKTVPANGLAGPKQGGALLVTHLGAKTVVEPAQQVVASPLAEMIMARGAAPALVAVAGGSILDALGGVAVQAVHAKYYRPSFG
jgi:hypothetical protein